MAAFYNDTTILHVPRTGGMWLRRNLWRHRAQAPYRSTPWVLTHATWSTLFDAGWRAARIVVVRRDYYDWAVSAHKFFNGWHSRMVPTAAVDVRPLLLLTQLPLADFIEQARDPFAEYQANMERDATDIVPFESLLADVQKLFPYVAFDPTPYNQSE